MKDYPEVEVRAEGPVDFGRTVALHIVDRRGKEFRVATSITMETIAEGEMLPRPAVTLRVSAAQQLMDDLWRCGIRPTDGTGSAGALAATERHLEDMRTLVFKKEPK